MNDLPFGIDLSRYQYSSDGKQKPDFDKINATCDFVAVRAGISWGYTDPWFAYSWAHIVKPRLAYHVVYPGEDANRQMEHFLNIVKPESSDRLVLDMELDHGVGKTRITDTLNQCLRSILEKTGRYPVVYSRANWINQFVAVEDLPPNLDWWLAHYLARRPAPLYTPEKAPPPRLPNGVSKWLIHQTGERGNGSEVGVASYYVDTNRWNGTMEQMRAWFGLGEDEPEPEEPTNELYRAKVTATIGLRIRSGAGLEYPQIGSLVYGQEVSVFEERNGWGRIDPAEQRWSSLQYLERISSGQPPATANYAYFGGVYSQRDVRWKDHPLGTKSTIGANGCLVTCVAMVCNHFWHATNPLALNRWLTENEGYLDGNLFLWASIERLYPDMHFDGFVYNPTTAQIRAAILGGTLPIMFVDFDDDTPLIEMHWVLGIGVTADDVLIADPWTGTIGKLSEMYPKSVIRYGSYIRI